MATIMDSKSPRKNRAPNSRALGAVRASGSATKFPPILNNRIDGITGAAMGVPPRPMAPVHVAIEKPPPTIDRAALSTERSQAPHLAEKAKKSDTARKSPQPPKQDRDDSAKLKARIEELKLQVTQTAESAVTREKELKLEILQLQKLVDELKMQIWDKEKVIEQLKEQFLRQEEHYRELYEKECALHGGTKEDLRVKVIEMEKARQEHERVETELRKNCENIKIKLQGELDSVKQQMSHEIATRDEKLAKIKRQMAETLRGNSWERQQQLDELSKELTKAHEEIDMLKMKLRSNNRHPTK